MFAGTASGPKNAMSHFIEVASTDQLAAGTGALVKLPDTAIALFNVKGKIFAIDDVCVRCGSSLAAGTLRATVIGCSGCDWHYDVTTGCVSGMPALRTETYEAKIVGASVFVATIAKNTT